MDKGETNKRFLALTDGSRLCYEVYGDTSFTHPCFYCHGFPGCRKEIAPWSDLAKKLGLTIISIDRPGVGESDYSASRTLSSWPSIIEQLATELSVDRFSLLGLSGGGPYALETASTLQDRTKGLFLMSPMGPLSCPSAVEGVVFRNRIVLELVRRCGALCVPVIALMRYGAMLFPSLVVTWLSKGLNQDDNAVIFRPEIQAVVSTNLHESFGGGSRGILREIQILASPWDVRPVSPRTSVHLWHGTEDYYVSPHMARYIAAQIPHTSLELIEGRGHFMVIDLMSKFLKLIRDTETEGQS